MAEVKSGVLSTWSREDFVKARKIVEIHKSLCPKTAEGEFEKVEHQRVLAMLSMALRGIDHLENIAADTADDESLEGITAAHIFQMCAQRLFEIKFGQLPSE